MINRKSFLICKYIYGEEEWNHIHMKDNWTLNWEPGLNVVCSDNHDVILIGDCWSIFRDFDVDKEIRHSSANSYDKLLEAEKYWCGRYILIIGSTIYMDARGLLSLFYSDEYISNSLNLLRDIEGYNMVKERIYYGIAPDYIPGVKTPYNRIRRLLPSMSYNYINKQTGSRPLLAKVVNRYQDENKLVADFVEAFASCLINMSEFYKGKRMLVACTGGRDSRTTLSVMEYAKIDFELFLLEHDHISGADISISKKIAEQLGKKQYYIGKPRRNKNRDRLSAFDIHTCNYVIGADRMFYAYGQYDDLRKALKEDIVVVRGGLWESVCEYSNVKSNKDICDTLQLLKYNRLLRESVNEWLTVVDEDRENDDVSLSDRMHIDLRDGCWLSSIEQSLDIYEGLTSVQPLNCRYLFSLLLQFDTKLRKNKLHEERIVQYACKPLSKIEYDYEHASFSMDWNKRMVARIKKAVWLLSNYGVYALFDYYNNRNVRL